MSRLQNGEKDEHTDQTRRAQLADNHCPGYHENHFDVEAGELQRLSTRNGVLGIPVLERTEAGEADVRVDVLKDRNLDLRTVDRRTRCARDRGDRTARPRPSPMPPAARTVISPAASSRWDSDSCLHPCITEP